MQFDDRDVGSRLRNQHRAHFTGDIWDTWTPIQRISRQFQVGRSYSAQVLRAAFATVIGKNNSPLMSG